MRRSISAASLCAACLFAATLFAQDRSAELDKAYEEARAAYLALKAAEQRRDQGVESLPGERIGTVAGGAVGSGSGSAGPGGGASPGDGSGAANKTGRRTRLSNAYFERQAQLEQEVELARKRYEAAVKRWNDLK